MKQIFVILTLLLPFCAVSQINESFNGTEITTNYPWEGDLDKFITEDGFLRLYDIGRNSEAMVYLYGTTLGENEWTFRVKSGYMTSDANYFRIYLWCNKIDLSTHHKAYFVELGKSQKKIALCWTEGRQVVDTLVSRVINNLNNAFDLHIKVTATADGRMSLYGRSDESPDYTLIGTTTYERQITPGYFILYCNYSTEHAKDKYFGPIRINDLSLYRDSDSGEGTDRLKLLSVWQESATTLNLTFNHAVDPTYASFSLNSLGEVSEIYLAEDERQVRLVWETAMQKGKSYTLSYSELYDNEGTIYSGTAEPFTATKDVVTPVIPVYRKGDLIINEVMANPNGAAGLPETEYVELRNTTGQDIALTGWSFLYGDKSTPLKSTIPSEGYAVLYRSGRDIQVDKGGISIPLSTFPSALANTGKNVSLIYNESTTIDDTAYPSAKAGLSWERSGATWKLSTDSRGGTPGSANSTASAETPGGEEDNEGDSAVMPFEVVFSEILPEPAEGGSEYIELYNRSEYELSLGGLSVATRKSDGSLSTNYSLASVGNSLGAGEYVVLTKSAEGVYDFFLTPSPGSIHELKLPILSNTSAQLVLFRSGDKKVIDEVNYSYKWHSASVKNRKGVALEKIDPDGSSQDPDNWTSASTLSGGGTPGYRNSQATKLPGETPTGIEAPEYNPSAGNYGIAYRLDRAGYRCRASIYETSGRRIVEIANHELTGTQGVFTWDGFAAGGQKPPAGVYIFYAEVYHPEGARKIYKKVFLVR